MTTLTYRGKNYVQNKKVSNKKLIELKYRRNVYTSRIETASRDQKDSKLCYRGVLYLR